ncbi:hypothetical protein B0I35DRAFT_458886 [Stachybotrys elegans]|uniref:Ion transport domain-containing protein n=1 Tax=Stachybotrys elegans TaxID=80388 RepID=A0A8K0SWY9_9HYPO|nr:hypothetical protein B0I35DRAFT_458886 [Stachybotrys elegans]
MADGISMTPRSASPLFPALSRPGSASISMARSASAQDMRDDEEREPCLGGPPPPVFHNMHRVRQLVLTSIDDPYTLEQLTSPRVNTLVVRLLVDRLYEAEDPCIVYCLLANRVQFLREQTAVALHSVNVARARLCELVATRILRKFHEDNPGSLGLLLLSTILVQGFDPFSGAPDQVAAAGRYCQWPVQQRGGHERKLTALELAILSESKTFISSPACQRVVNAVYEGRIVYTSLSFVDILPDHYKHHAVSLYDPRKAPLLDHYRLVVPRIRNLIELIEFLALVVLFMATMLQRKPDAVGLTLCEGFFAVYASAWLLEQFASFIEHGWEVHSHNLWSFLDLSFSLIFIVYAIFRSHDLLAGTVLPIVRVCILAFNIMPDNIVFISLHAMVRDFTLLTFIALWCFTGFLLALKWLSMGHLTASDPSWWEVTKWLLWIWFGLDGTGIDEADTFHSVLGPSLMISFAFLGNTLFLTILVALLTSTFSRIIADETAEICFRRAVLTFEGVKSDAIFAYPPPFNLVALITLLPLKQLVSPRTFHSVHVALVRCLNLPTLLLVSLYERRTMWARARPRNLQSRRRWRFSGFSPHGDIQAVFESDPPISVQDEAEELDGLSDMGFLDNDVISRSSREIKRGIVFRLGESGHRDLSIRSRSR